MRSRLTLEYTRNDATFPTDYDQSKSPYSNFLAFTHDLAIKELNYSTAIGGVYF